MFFPASRLREYKHYIHKKKILVYFQELRFKEKINSAQAAAILQRERFRHKVRQKSAFHGQLSKSINKMKSQVTCQLGVMNQILDRCF
jgi:hypothetical protein